MNQNTEPEDPWDDYIESTELLAQLTEKRAEVERNRVQLEARGHNTAALIASIDEHRAGIQQHLAIHEQRMEGMLQEAAQRAESGRSLFLAVANVMKALERLTPEQWEQMPEKKRQDWERLLNQYTNLRQQWETQLTSEERERLRE